MFFKKFKDLILGVVMAAFAVFYEVNASQIKTRPKLTPAYASAPAIPKFLGWLLLGLAVLLIVQGIMKIIKFDPEKETVKKMAKGDMIAVTCTIGVIALYIVLLANGFGFILASMIYLFLQMIVLAPPEKRNFLLFAIIAVVFAVAVFFIFREGLSQLLPRGPIEKFFGY